MPKEVGDELLMVIHSSVSESAYSVPGTILGTVRDRAVSKTEKIPAPRGVCSWIEIDNKQEKSK